MEYGTLELDITDVLNGYFTDNALTDLFTARPYPENQEELLQDFEKGMCNVGYVDSEYGPPESTSTIEQTETVTVGVFMRCDNLKSENGAYKLLAAVKKALIGYKPTDARTRMWIADYKGWSIEQGQIGDVLLFKFDTVNVQSIEEAETEVISSTGNVTVTGNLAEIDSELYASDDPAAEPIGDEQVVLGDEIATE